MMKKLFSILSVIILCLTINVYALEDKIVIKSDGDKLTYDKSLIHTNDFIVRDNMLPGESYNDSLTIENKSTKNFSLYFKLEPKSNTDLLDYLTVVIKLDGTTVYTGAINDAKNSTNPNNAILLKRLDKNETTHLTVKTTVSNDYTNKNNTSASEIDLKFYAMYGNSGDNPTPPSGGGENPSNPTNPTNPSTNKPVEIEPVPHTGIDKQY